MYWFEFIISAGVIIAAGSRLTVYADKLSEKLNIGKVWVGIVLLGLVTSLPEAVTSLVAVVSLQANDLAIGNLLGSNNINPLLIVILDLVYRQGSITNAIVPNTSQKVAGLLALLLSFIVVTNILFDHYQMNLSVGIFSWGSLLIGITYVLGMRHLSTLGAGSHPSAGFTELKGGDSSLRRIVLNLLICTIFIVLGAIWLANSADMIAQETGLGRTFVGSIFLAFVTSLPEIVVTVSAVKLKKFDLAIGNIFGSNMTNIFIVFLCDIFYTDNTILASVGFSHVVTASLSILLVLILLWGIHRKDKPTFAGIGIDSLWMIILFVSGYMLLYVFRFV